MAIKIAINGVGRIGKALIKLALSSDNFQLTHINDLIPPEQILYLLKYDSVQKGLEELTLENNTFIYKDQSFLVSNFHDNKDFKPDADIVIDATGVYKTVQDNTHYLNGRVKKVIIASMPSDDMGVAAFKINEEALKDDVVAFGSCTTTPLAFIIDILREKLNIKSGTVTSIHSYNSDQNLLDSKHPSCLRRTRSSPNNIIPIDTGAAKNLGKVLKDLDFELAGRGIRVPIADVSVLDIVLKLEGSITAKEINQELQTKIRSEYSEILNTTDELLVSSDFIGSSYAGVVDLESTLVLNNLAKIIVWHDNEYGYANYLLNFLKKVEKIGAF